MSSVSRVERSRLTSVYERGLERCRQGDWQDGLVDLAWLAERAGRGDVPALCYSYLGYGLAHQKGQVKKGLKLCKHAVKLEFYQPECYVNLAQTALLSKSHRHLAAVAVIDGLQIDSDHPELVELSHRLGVRRPPVLSFLSRNNTLNRLLGWFRHQIKPGKPRSRTDEPLPESSNSG